MSPRRAKTISVFRESVVAAAVLLFTVPPLLGFCIVAFANLLEFGNHSQEPAMSVLGWVGIWALLSTVVLSLGIAVTTSRVRAGRDQPHYDEYRDFTLMRHARHGPLIDPKRTHDGGAEVLSFGLEYMLAAQPVPAWWPVVMPSDTDDLVTFRHRVFLSVLPCEPPPFALWSKTHRWDARQTDRVVRGEPCDVSAKLGERFDLHGTSSVAELFRDEGLTRLMLSNTEWSMEVRGDRLLAYRLPRRDCRSGVVADDTLDEREGISFVTELAEALGRATERAGSGIRSGGFASRLGVDRAVSWWGNLDRRWNSRPA